MVNKTHSYFAVILIACICLVGCSTEKAEGVRSNGENHQKIEIIDTLELGEVINYSNDTGVQIAKNNTYDNTNSAEGNIENGTEY